MWLSGTGMMSTNSIIGTINYQVSVTDSSRTPCSAIGLIQILLTVPAYSVSTDAASRFYPRSSFAWIMISTEVTQSHTFPVSRETKPETTHCPFYAP